MTAIVQTVTIEEFQNLPDDGVRRELVRGEVREMTPTNFEHLEVRSEIEFLLKRFATQHGLGVVGGEGGFVLGHDPAIVLSPDIVFVSKGRVPTGPERRGFPELAPDLVVEVLSPSNSAMEMSEKVAIYLRSGVRLVWVVDPIQRTITAYRADHAAHLHMDDETIDGGDVLPGFSMAVADAFA